jgi:hypothetical protein
MLKRRFVGRGMHLEFCHPEYRTPIITSLIQEIWEGAQLSPSEMAELQESLSATSQCASVLTKSVPPLPRNMPV